MGFLEIISIVIFPISLGSLQLAVESGWGSGLDLGHSNVLTRAKDISLGASYWERNKKP